ncbi:MAG: porin [Gammaproteobacteria bacterium]|nr:porin [Gammaproteobacteria bacterium]MCP5196114.1 porin [Gammaproteobacteria bacterium]
MYHYNNSLCLGIVGASTFLLLAPAQADQLDDLLHQLREKGVLNQQEYRMLSKQATTAAPTPVGQAEVIDQLMQRLKAKGILTQSEYAKLSSTALAPATPTETISADESATASTSDTIAPSTADAPAGGTVVRTLEKGVGVRIGSVDVQLSGGVNAFYVHNSPDHQDAHNVVAGGIAGANGQNSASVRNGLLPSNFSVSIKTQQQGYDVGATFGLYPGLNSVSGVGGANSAGNPRALGTSGIDFRQQFITVGTPVMGTFKGGRDIGLFGAQAILNDFSLLGVGTPGNNVAPSNTSFGRIGLGYVYTDFQPQITYTSPPFNGLTVSLGVFTPLDAVNFSGESGVLEAHDQPGLQGQLIYEKDLGNVGTKLWTSFVTQKLESDGIDNGDALPKGKSVRASGFDLGGKFTIGPANLVLYGYNGKALGSTGLFFDAISQTGEARDSHGFYAQGTYQFLERFTLGVSYGASYLDEASGEDSPLLVKRNESWLGGLRYQLTDWVQLAGEYTHTMSEAHGGNSADEDTVAVGASLFF